MFINRRQNLKRDAGVSLVAGLMVSLMAWSIGFSYLDTARAASLTNVSDTLSESRPGFTAVHTIAYTNPSSTAAGQTITYTFDPTTSAFGSVTSTAIANVTSTGMTIATSTCPGSGANVQMATTSYSVLTFTVCGGNTIPSGTISLKISNVIANPTSTGSYIIRIGGTQVNAADTRIAITNGVAVTAAVATTFTFVVAGLPTSTTLGNGATTTGSTVPSSSTLPFGTIAPNTHNELGQQLFVTTNASNGFAVTVHEDQDMTSNKGNTIHLFKNGVSSSTPAAWTSPTNVINQPATYGHIGVTSDDTDLAGGAFGTSTSLYAGAFNPTSTLTIFSATGTSDGVTQNIGTAKVAYRIEIGTLQAAANDYVNNLIYVATPVF